MSPSTLNIAPETPTLRTAMKRVHVAVGVVINAQGFILVSKRPDHVHLGGLWEFPGGKVEPDENVQQALTRELLEELAIAVISSEPLIAIEHDYSDKSVLLDVWWVDDFDGEPHGREGQLWQWIAVEALRGLEFPAANKPIIDAIEAQIYSRGGLSSENKSSESKSS
jgi:8-oxo-dGTP diphosphatase